MILTEHVTLGDSGKRMAGIKAPGFDGTQPCKDVDPELFFPESRAEELETIKLLKPICTHCSFTAPCLEWAVNNKEFGFWAGTTTDQRRSIIRKRQRQK